MFKGSARKQIFNKFLLIDATDRSKISSDQTRLFYTPFHFSRTLPLSEFDYFVKYYLNMNITHLNVQFKNKLIWKLTSTI